MAEPKKPPAAPMNRPPFALCSESPRFTSPRAVAHAALAIALLVPMPAGAEAPQGAKAQPKAEGKKTEAPKGPKWQSLFDGKKLGKWKVIDQYDFSRHGSVYVKDGSIVQEAGKPATGVRWTGDFPKINYEVELRAKRIEGDDFFCGMTFPVGKSSLTLVLGGWGGSVVGLSSIDDEPAVENETCTYEDFEQNRWYRIRLRVAKERIEAWIDKRKVVELHTAHRKFTIYWEVEPCLPFGIATWYTTGALGDIRVRTIEPKPPGRP
jgi:hypothetical protein